MSTAADIIQRVPVRIRLGNAIMQRLLRLGVGLTPMVLLTVRGRRTGRPRTTPVGLLLHDGHRYLFSAFGEVNWVRNLRAAGVGIIARGRHRETLRVAELSAEEAGQILQSILKSPTFGRVVRPYFPVAADAPLAAFVHEARRHPFFELGVPTEPTSSENASLES
jgi:deazaflavin-dependent oxidoreductase (nitroreductase family)